DERRLRLAGAGEMPLDPRPRRPRIPGAGHRVARLPGGRFERDDRLGAANDAAFFLVDAEMMGEPAALGLAVLMGEGGRLAGGEQSIDGAPRRAAAFRIELAEQLHQRHPPARLLAEPHLAGEGGAELDRPRTRLPAPRSARRRPARLAGADRAPSP